MRCDTPEWAAYAAYCGLWIAVYTVGFPVMMAVFLKRNAGHIKEHHEDVLDPFYKEVRKLTMAYPNPNGTLTPGRVPLERLSTCLLLLGR